MFNHEILSSISTHNKLNINCEEIYRKLLNLKIYKDIIFNNHKYNTIYQNPKLLANNPQLRENIVKGIRKIYYNNIPLINPIEYNAFFPQTFYSIWETINEFDLISNQAKSFLFIGDDNLGHIEAVTKYCEDYFCYEMNEYTLATTSVSRQHDNKQFSMTYGNYAIVNSDQLEGIATFDFMVSFDEHIDVVKYMKPHTNALIYIGNIINLDSQYISNLKSQYENIYICQTHISDPLEAYCWLILINKKEIATSIIQTNIISIQNQFITQYINNLLALYSKISKHDNDETIIDNSYAISWAHHYNLQLKSDIYPNWNPIYLSYTLNKYSGTNKLTEEIFDQMHASKRLLNKYKRLLATKEYGVDNDTIKDIIDMNKVHMHTNFYGSLLKMISWKYNTEMANNTWTKIYELISREKLISSDITEFKSFHLCETYGSSIYAVNHYIKTKTKIKQFNWYANYYTSKDSKQYKLAELYPNQWLTNMYGSSDLRTKSVIDSYIKNPILDNINLVICDGSNYVSIFKQTEQESMTAFVTFLQIYTTFHTLSTSGNAIIKVFLPLVESMTISLLYLLVKSFAIVKLVKPTVSHVDSSELYCVCKSYNGIESIHPDILTKLDSLHKKFRITDSIYPLNTIDMTFITSLTKAIDDMIKNCIAGIERSLYLRNHYYDDYELQKNITEEKEQNINKWIIDANITVISQEDKLLN